MKRRLSFILLFVGLLALVGWLIMPSNETVLVDIPNGLSASQTARLLRGHGVIRSAWFFKAYAKITEQEKNLKPGRYRFRKGSWPGAILKRLAAGDSEVSRVVIPEGFMAKQIADRLGAQGVTSSAAFMDYVRRNNLEGFLFPSTYMFGKDLPAEAVAHRMHREFLQLVEPDIRNAPQNRLGLRQVVTLSSIVQREARRTKEMPMIAAVYLNRLRRHMRLQADPTVQYALGKDTGRWRQNLRAKDLEIFSTYNTYLNFGLPPGPICSPGLEAVRAVLHPAETDAIYFVADNSGGHIFSNSLDEHINATHRTRRERRLKQN